MEKERSLLEPTGTVQRVVYALLSVLLPKMMIQLYFWGKLDDFAGVILCFWWVITFVYTVGWALSGYRGWKKRRGLA